MEQAQQIEVFKTTISNQGQADAFKTLLLERFPHLSIDFDLEDCDRILRIASTEEVCCNDIRTIGRRMEVQIEVLEG